MERDHVIARNAALGRAEWAMIGELPSSAK
jgi:hypothetical protein